MRHHTVLAVLSIPAIASLLLHLASPFADASSWTKLEFASESPPARMAHVAVLDPLRSRMIVVGGLDIGGLMNDVWALSMDPAPAWSNLSPTGTAPTPRWDHAAAYDSRGDRLLIFGGEDTVSRRNDVWALSLDASPEWVEISTDGARPASRSSHTALFDSLGNRLIIHGGHDGFGFRGDLWELTLNGTPTWRQIIPAGETPSARRDAIAAYDAARHRFLLHGGYNGMAGFLNDAWAFDLTGSPTWTPIVPVNDPPVGSITHAGAYDSARDRLVIFGGSDHHQTWALTLSEPITWTEIQATGPLPPGRIDHTLVYSPEGDRMIAYAGHTGLAALADAWTLDLSPTSAVPGSSVSSMSLSVWPNPASRDVVLRASGSTSEATVLIIVHDVHGRRVRELRYPTGDGAMVRWDLRDTAGMRLAPGVYFCELHGSGDRGIVRRLVITF